MNRRIVAQVIVTVLLGLGLSRAACAQDVPVVFIHGIFSNGNEWRTTSARLASTLQIKPYVVDLSSTDTLNTQTHRSTRPWGACPRTPSPWDTARAGSSRGSGIARGRSRVSSRWARRTAVPCSRSERWTSSTTTAWCTTWPDSSALWFRHGVLVDHRGPSTGALEHAVAHLQRTGVDGLHRGGRRPSACGGAAGALFRVPEQPQLRQQPRTRARLRCEARQPRATRRTNTGAEALEWALLPTIETGYGRWSWARRRSWIRRGGRRRQLWALQLRGALSRYTAA